MPWSVEPLLYSIKIGGGSFYDGTVDCRLAVVSALKREFSGRSGNHNPCDLPLKQLLSGMIVAVEE